MEYGKTYEKTLNVFNIRINKNDLNEGFIKSNVDDPALICRSIYDKYTISNVRSLKTIKDEISNFFYGYR